MVNPDDVERSLNEHFEQISLDQFRERYDEYVGAVDSSRIPMVYVDDSLDVMLHQRKQLHWSLRRIWRRR